MANLDRGKPQFGDLRQRAEAVIRMSHTQVAAMPVEDVQQLVQELQIHQVELSMQNEELQRAYAELAAARNRFQVLYDFAPIGFLTLNADLAVKEANFTAAKLLGRPRERMIGSHFFQLVSPNSQGDFRALFPPPRGTSTQTIELEMRRLDGSLFPARLSYAPSWDAQSQPEVRMTLADVTEERRAQEKEARLAVIAATTQDAIVRCDPDGRITDWNPGAERIYGYTASQAVGRELAIIVPPNLLNAEKALMEDVARGRAVSDRETRRRAKDGREIPVSVSQSAVIGLTGQLRAFFSIERDISRQKAYEEKIQEEARHKDEFLAILGHELRNPLAAVQVEIDRLQAGDSRNRETLDMLQTLLRNIRQITSIVNDLMDVSRVMRGKVILNKQPVELQSAVRHTLEPLRPLSREKRVTWEEQLPAEPVWLEADPVRLEQILSNLLENAVKYNVPDGRVWVSARATPAGEEIRIKDTGIGMKTALQKSIFDLFNQADREKNSQGGLGVGLTMAHNLAQLHGGSLTVSSDGPGRGSEFTLTLPRAAAPKAQAPAGPPQKAGARLRLLLVDDNRDFAEGLAELLQELGHEVRTAFTGGEGLAAAPGFRPDVVLLDVGLPDLDGYEVGRRLSRMPELSQTKLIALTGYSEVPPLLSAEGARFQDVLIKPVEIAKLEQLLSRFTPQPSSG